MCVSGSGLRILEAGKPFEAGGPSGTQVEAGPMRVLFVTVAAVTLQLVAGSAGADFI